jgi:RHS repeat-associated protein
MRLRASLKTALLLLLGVLLPRAAHAAIPLDDELRLGAAALPELPPALVAVEQRERERAACGAFCGEAAPLRLEGGGPAERRRPGGVLAVELDGAGASLYAKARYFDPQFGRFLTQDSYLGQIDDPPSLHRYFYGNANPTRYVDPDGHQAVSPNEKDEKDEILERVKTDDSQASPELRQALAEHEARHAQDAEVVEEEPTALERGWNWVAGKFGEARAKAGALGRRIGTYLGGTPIDSTPTTDEDVEQKYGPENAKNPYFRDLIKDKNLAHRIDETGKEVGGEGGQLGGEAAFDYGTGKGVQIGVGVLAGGGRRLRSLAAGAQEEIELTGKAKNARWAKARQGVQGPGLRDHFEKHGDEVGATSAREFDRSARVTMERGRKFNYRDRSTNEPRVGYWDPETNRFTATRESGRRPEILTHFEVSWDDLRKLPGFTSTR